ncbi:MAG: methyl-accepting chemotaxis protein [Oscillospiraceae bacterium]
MKSIKTRILMSTIILVLTLVLVLGGCSIFFNYRSTNEVLKEAMTQTASIASRRISEELRAYTNVAYDAGSIARLAKTDGSVAEKQELIDQRAKTHGFERGNIIGMNGKSIFDGKDYSEREYFKTAMEGKASVSEPVLSKVTNKLAMIVAAPLWQNGIPDTKVVGCVYFAPTSTFLNDVVNSIKISENGSAYIVDKEGNTIAHKDIKRVEETENVENIAKTNKALAPLAAIHSKMRAGETGFETYTFAGDTKFVAFAPIPDSDGWSIAVNAPTTDFLDGMIISIVITAVLMVVGIFAALAVATVSANAIHKPLKICTRRLELLAHGDLSTEMEDVNTKDETKVLANSTVTIVEALKLVISDLSNCLTEFGNGNFTAKLQHQEIFIADFEPLGIAINKIIDQLSAAIVQIRISSEEVAGGSDQVSSGAQALSQGATEQASSVQELSATIQEIYSQVQQNAKDALTANENAAIVEKEIENGDEQMHNLTKAMEDINDSSSKIGKIIKTIEDIAFQTNILALNAAVEAARAGEEGKGFTVVADEIRRLAEKSSEAAEGTLDLIQNTLKAIKNGTKVARETAKNLRHVVNETAEVAGLVDEIAESCENQFQNIAEVTGNIDKISAVIQSNSATGEQSAATSEQLSAQAVSLEQLLAKFNLRDADHLVTNKKPTKEGISQEEILQDEQQTKEELSADLAYYNAMPLDSVDEELAKAIAQEPNAALAGEYGVYDEVASEADLQDLMKQDGADEDVIKNIEDIFSATDELPVVAINKQAVPTGRAKYNYFGDSTGDIEQEEQPLPSAKKSATKKATTPKTAPKPKAPSKPKAEGTKTTTKTTTKKAEASTDNGEEKPKAAPKKPRAKKQTANPEAVSTDMPENAKDNSEIK